VIIHVAGNVTTERDLIASMHAALLTYGRQNVNVGLS